jgi:hypothetical protein
MSWWFGATRTSCAVVMSLSRPICSRFLRVPTSSRFRFSTTYKETGEWHAHNTTPGVRSLELGAHPGRRCQTMWPTRAPLHEGHGHLEGLQQLQVRRGRHVVVPAQHVVVVLGPARHTLVHHLRGQRRGKWTRNEQLTPFVDCQNTRLSCLCIGIPCVPVKLMERDRGTGKQHTMMR